MGRPPTPPVVDGIAAIQSRITAIEARFGAHRTPPPSPSAAEQARAPAGVATSFAGTAAPRSSSTGTSFGRVYADTLAASTAPTPARRLAPGAYGRLQPPAELVAYGNGRVPPAALTPIGDGEHRLHAPAARAFDQMAAAARADGVDLDIISSYRDLGTQQRLAREKGLYSQGGLAATPGTSNHGWGLAVDLELDSRAQSWMRANGWRYGFVEDVPREPWHWTYRPA